MNVGHETQSLKGSAELTQQTRARLLEVAGEVFAEYGFRAATIREICRRAEANIAAVNYHFRGKEGLYSECLSHFLTAALEKYPPTMGLGENPTPEQKLHAYVRSFLYRILDESRNGCYGRLIARNMIEASPFLDVCAEQFFRPMAQRLYGIIREIVGANVPERQVQLFGLSIVGQIVFHRHSQPVICKLFPNLTYTHDELDALAEHITQFSLARLREVASANKQLLPQSSEQVK
jgi:AcrR family transcriptional regulator